MRKLMTLALLLAVFQSRSQSFEGTIKWSMTMEITDPETKAKMDQAQQKMNDPATQAKMKEMQAKMNDPQFKAMMESNPQMKAQMENMMKMQAGGGDPGSMMPKGMTIKIKGKNMSSKMDGGMMDGFEVIHLGDKNQSYRVDRANKTYSPLPQGKDGGQGGPAPDVTVTKTSETMKILNYNCTKYIVEMTERGKKITENVWATNEIKDVDMKALANQRSGQRGMVMFHEKIDGLPLKVEAMMPEGKMNMEVTDINRNPVSAADISIPSDFKEGKMGMF